MEMSQFMSGRGHPNWISSHTENIRGDEGCILVRFAQLDETVEKKLIAHFKPNEFDSCEINRSQKTVTITKYTGMSPKKIMMFIKKLDPRAEKLDPPR